MYGAISLLTFPHRQDLDFIFNVMFFKCTDCVHCNRKIHPVRSIECRGQCASINHGVNEDV